MAKRKHGRVASARRGPTLLDLMKKDRARVLRVLEKHGIHLDASTYITLTATLEKAAAYHAVADRKKFLRDLLGK
jgi:hypothetical protein